MAALFVTIFIGILNLNLAKNTRFINSVNSERVKWVNNVGEIFSEFNKNAYLQARRLEDLSIKKQQKLILYQVK